MEWDKNMGKRKQSEFIIELYICERRFDGKLKNGGDF